jgi:hypothetical protein
MTCNALGLPRRKRRFGRCALCHPAPRGVRLQQGDGLSKECARGLVVAIQGLCRIGDELEEDC